MCVRGKGVHMYVYYTQSCGKLDPPSTLHKTNDCSSSAGQSFLIWMSVMFVAFLYNAISIPLRASFEVQRGRGIAGWLLFDYIFDLVYILDILLVQAHLSYRSNGVLEVCSIDCCWSACDECNMYYNV